MVNSYDVGMRSGVLTVQNVSLPKHCWYEFVPTVSALRQFSRNELVSGLFARCPLPSNVDAGERSFIMDRRGEGVPIIIRETEKLAGHVPIIKDIDGQEVCVVLPAAFNVSDNI